MASANSSCHGQAEATGGAEKSLIKLAFVDGGFVWPPSI